MKISDGYINILVTLDKNYIPYLNVMLSSLIKKNSDSRFCVYVLHSSLEDSDVEITKRVLGKENKLILINADSIGLDDAPTTSRYPKEIYYRIFAAKFLPPTLDRVLYLDPDLVVNGSLKELYNMDMKGYLFAAASHTGPFVRAINGIRLDMEENAPYINSGVMLMNLKLLRKEQNYDDVFKFIEKRKNYLVLPDQDIISSLYGSRIYALDTFVYNMTEKLFLLHAPFERELTLDWIRKNSVIIHYCGRNKPWKENYKGYLDVFYKEASSNVNKEFKER